MRAWNRFAVFTSLGLSLLAGIGFDVWINEEIKPKYSFKKTYILIFAFMSLALFELYPRPIPLQPISPRPVDLWLASQPEQGSLMEIPFKQVL